MTREELNERIEDIIEKPVDAVAESGWPVEEFAKACADTKQLIRDCIEAVTPGTLEAYGTSWNRILDKIEANTEELLG